MKKQSHYRLCSCGRNSGEELILVRIQDPTPGIWTFHVSASGSLYNGNFHMWLPITEFLSTPVYFLNPDPDMTLTEPSMAPEVLSVSTYNAETTVLRRIRQRLRTHRADPSGLIRSRSQYLHH